MSSRIHPVKLGNRAAGCSASAPWSCSPTAPIPRPASDADYLRQDGLAPLIVMATASQSAPRSATLQHLHGIARGAQADLFASFPVALDSGLSGIMEWLRPSLDSHASTPNPPPSHWLRGSPARILQAERRSGINVEQTFELK